jgi:hypothetical protein
MEQYVHLLIAEDPAFAPTPQVVQRFFEWFIASSRFQLVRSSSPFEPGLLVAKPSGRMRKGQDCTTGEEISIPELTHIRLSSIEEISPSIADLSHYMVLATGRWTSQNCPLSLITPERLPFDGEIFGDVSCLLRPAPVSTSGWSYEFSEAQNTPEFDHPFSEDSSVGIFSNPWTGKIIEVPGAGCSRFWIEIGFGKFLMPDIKDNLDLMCPNILQSIERHFETRFVQGCRFE